MFRLVNCGAILKLLKGGLEAFFVSNPPSWRAELDLFVTIEFKNDLPTFPAM